MPKQIFNSNMEVKGATIESTEENEEYSIGK